MHLINTYWIVSFQLKINTLSGFVFEKAKSKIFYFFSYFEGNCMEQEYYSDIIQWLQKAINNSVWDSDCLREKKAGGENWRTEELGGPQNWCGVCPSVTLQAPRWSFSTPTAHWNHTGSLKKMIDAWFLQGPHVFSLLFSGIWHSACPVMKIH